MAYENARLQLGAKPTTNMFGDKLQSDFSYYEEMIDKMIGKISNKITDLENKLSNVAGDSFAKKIADEISNIQIKLTVADMLKKN
jgi:hypothetical protein